jgi:hypothetical protein
MCRGIFFLVGLTCSAILCLLTTFLLRLGEFPPSILELRNLRVLNLSHNQFHGEQ